MVTQCDSRAAGLVLGTNKLLTFAVTMSRLRALGFDLESCGRYLSSISMHCHVYSQARQSSSYDAAWKVQILLVVSKHAHSSVKWNCVLPEPVATHLQQLLVQLADPRSFC